MSLWPNLYLECDVMYISPLLASLGFKTLHFASRMQENSVFIIQQNMPGEILANFLQHV